MSHIGLYLVGTIPTGNRSKVDYLFEPLIGTNHGAFGVGINADFNLNKDDHAHLSFMCDTKYRYLFSGTERRSFDLAANGDWSRYLLVVNRNTTSLSRPGINVSTYDVNVTPGSQIESWWALHYECNHWNIEAGYNFWWRDADYISNNLTFPPNTGIYDLAGAVGGTPISASGANISEAAIPPNEAPSDSTFTPSTRLNPSSGAQPAAWANGLYLAMSYNDNEAPYPFLIGAGGGYEFANRHTLSQWSVWCKLGFVY